MLLFNFRFGQRTFLSFEQVPDVVSLFELSICRVCRDQFESKKYVLTEQVLSKAFKYVFVGFV